LEGETVTFEAEMPYSHGATRWMLQTLVPHLDQDGDVRGFVVHGVDISRQKEEAEERERLHAQLLNAQKLEAVGTLAGAVAHELNNPINGVMNFAQLILDQAGENRLLRQNAEEIIRESERMAAVVRDLLRFSRHEEPDVVPAPLHEIVQRSVALVGAMMRHDQVRLEVEVPETLPPIPCRPQRLQQVFVNLLTNARDALNEKYPGYHPDKVIRVFAQEYAQDGRSWIRVTVEDHGTGIPADLQRRVFDPFVTSKPGDRGTGLGLPISLSIVRDHRGRLSFETEPGQWTRFYVDLPLEEKSASAAPGTPRP
ncbi:MAG: HAMP domain-containing sensor histidine kinase, partial [Armatimonadota bacterium]|nr:HAMP domain-containing sensor histidine kinase [Armatimonadota bacterium]